MILDNYSNRSIKIDVHIDNNYDSIILNLISNNNEEEYLLLKSCELSNLENRILERINNNINNNTIQIEIINILHKLGIPSHIKGYLYIKESILLMYNKRISITKELYPKIAIIYNTTPIRVESAIRHAIDISWNRGDWDLMNNLFGNSIDINKAKPTNSEFILTIVDKIILDFN